MNKKAHLILLIFLGILQNNSFCFGQIQELQFNDTASINISKIEKNKTSIYIFSFAENNFGETKRLLTNLYLTESLGLIDSNKFVITNVTITNKVEICPPNQTFSIDGIELPITKYNHFYIVVDPEYNKNAFEAFRNQLPSKLNSTIKSIKKKTGPLSQLYSFEDDRVLISFISEKLISSNDSYLLAEVQKLQDYKTEDSSAKIKELAVLDSNEFISFSVTPFSSSYLHGFKKSDFNY